MKVWRDSNERRQPVLFAIDGKTSYVTEKNWGRMMSLRLKGQIPWPEQTTTIFFNTLDEMIERIEAETNSAISKFRT